LKTNHKDLKDDKTKTDAQNVFTILCFIFLGIKD
jgi:hypothetical protein